VTSQLSESQQALRAEARQYAQETIRPRAIDLDQSETYPTEILDDLAEMGYGGLTIPEAYGGMGEGMTELAVVVEELSAALMPVASALALHLGVAEVV
jgi:alkylation response protein AidB-like acyl-CoA dehydrogenase